MSAPTRRATLAGTAAATPATVAATGANALEQNPDAELIRVCAQHAINMDTLNSIDGWEENDPIWLAYDETRDFITKAEPKTFAGVLAMARAARHEATGLDGKENWPGGMGQEWAPEIINHLLRVTGGASIGGAA